MNDEIIYAYRPAVGSQPSALRFPSKSGVKFSDVFPPAKNPLLSVKLSVKMVKER